MHHWPGPGCWLSRVTPDPWNSSSGNFLEENSFIFCLDVYLLPRIAATPQQQRASLCLLHTEVAQSFWAPRCICDLPHLFPLTISTTSPVCFHGLTDVHPHVARALSLPAHDWASSIRVSPSSVPSVWLSPDMTMPFASHWYLSTCCTLTKSVWHVMTEHSFTSFPADSLFILTYIETVMSASGSCGTAVPIGLWFWSV